MKPDAPTIAPDQCRVCHGALYTEPLLSYTGMPAAAQNFPDASTIALDTAHDLDVYQCASCGLVQLTNSPVPYYKDVIRAVAFSEEMRDFRLNQLKHWAEKYDLTHRKVIEIGCGHGEYLSLLNTVGVDAYGIEHAEEAVAACQQVKLQVYQGYFGDYQQKKMSTKFDGFMCLNFMEHWPDPNASLSEISDRLTDQAIGLVEVPNFDMILEKGLFSEFISDHLFYFTQATFNFILQKNGFEVLECKPVWHDYILSAVVRKRTKTDLSYLNSFRVDLTTQVNQFVNQFQPKQVAIWGAGHQALAIISLAKLADKIAYVVDSATFKQGKLTPASHLPIVAPSTLNERPVNAIIVMAASYSDEVSQMIRSTFGNKMLIAVLRDHDLEVLDGAC